MKKIILPIVVVLCIVSAIVGFMWYDAHRLDEYANDPKVDDIYVMYADEIYAPMKIDLIDGSQISMVSSLYFFEGDVPNREDILDSEFDYSTYATYEHTDLLDMYEEGRIVEIYRD